MNFRACNRGASAVLYSPPRAERLLRVGGIEQCGKKNYEGDSFGHSTHEGLMLLMNAEHFQFVATGTHRSRSKRYRPPSECATDSATLRNARPACDSVPALR